MVRQWKEVWRTDGEQRQGSIVEDFNRVVFIFWAALAALSLVTAIMFSCSGGASKDKASATHTDTYGSNCAAECGAGCGG